MTNDDLLKEVDDILEQYGTGLLATLDEGGSPRMRWMTPFFLRDREGVLYCVTGADSRKVKQIEQNPRVSWLMQPPSLKQIVTLKGQARIERNYSLIAQALETAGGRLKTFWTVNNNPEELVLIETEVKGGEVFFPQKGERFKAGESKS